jgi:hypothetical protein
MKAFTNKKNRVFSGNDVINYHYFLVEISCPDYGHVGAYLVKQAYTGSMTDRKESALWNRIEEDCHQYGEKTGLRYQIRACGGRRWCLDTAMNNGYPLT